MDKEDERCSSPPVPQPRSRLQKKPVPLPRSVVNTECTVDNSVNNEEIPSSSSSVKSYPTSSIKRGLKRVTSFGHDTSTAVLETTKNVSSKIENSVRQILTKRMTVTSLPHPIKQEDNDELNCNRAQSLPTDDLFNNISFGSPLASDDIYEECPISLPPPYPPPPLPDESIYDHLCPSNKSNESINTISTNQRYEDIPEQNDDDDDIKADENDKSEISSNNAVAESVEQSLSRCNSWNYYDTAQGACALKIPGPTYENVAIEDNYIETVENIYSDEPGKTIFIKSKPQPEPIMDDKEPETVLEQEQQTNQNQDSSVDDLYSNVSSRSMVNEFYENWQPPAIQTREIPSRSNSPATRSVIYEFDPLFEERKRLRRPCIDELDNVEMLHIPDPPKRVDSLPETSDAPVIPNDIEYFLYHRNTGNSCFFVNDEASKESNSSKQEGKKISNLVRWTSMKRAIKMVTDGTPWTPNAVRKLKSGKGEDASSRPTPAKPHNGYILKSPSNGDKPKDFIQRWCQLGEGKLLLSTDKNTVGKELLPLENILSVQNIVEAKTGDDGSPIYCWELSVTGRTKPYLFGSLSSADSKMWMRKLLENLTNVFPSKLSSEYTRAGQCFVKEGISDEWNCAWVLLTKRTLYYCQIQGKMKEIDLRKVRFIALQTDKGCCTDVSDPGPHLQLYTVDRVIYFQMDTSKETKVWHQYIKTSASESGPTISDHQLTKDDVPVIVDKCINFVYAHGSMSEGIYRRSGANSNVTKLLSLFRADSWAVQLSRQDYTEYDVASVLKRWFIELPDPLLTAGLHKYFCNAARAAAKCTLNEKIGMFRTLLDKLPRINYVTLRRLIGHLHFIHEQAEKNKMPVDNLAAIWAPTLMHVEGKGGLEWSRRECSVLVELISNYKSMFLVDCEEVDREKRMLEVLERVHITSNIPQHKPSGDLKIAIYIGSKMNGEAVNIVVSPTMEAGDVCQQLAYKTEYSPHELCLTEMVLGGALSRPLHHSDKVLDTALRWAYWDSADCKDNYFLLGVNTLYRELVPLAKPPISKSGELKFADQKSKSFRNYLFEFSQAKLSYYKDKACSIKLNEWPIEDIIWYIGHEPKRNPQTRWAITFIQKNEPVKRTKETPYFGCTIAGSVREDQLQWMAAMLLAQFQHTDLLPRQNLV
ncbi:hypothetical protein O3M35_001622 [Rhynocoris fuscipes]|uniref:Arf-GAP with Rho-GAP domain, ANK repeat and PH domain-containing protein 2 n=1 Tax=Rhynocoris fuscipes TaxID=488301 RepID=A0AAW1CPA0_9HEMI